MVRAQDVVEKMQKANLVTCGIDQSEAEYSLTNEHGPRVAFDQAMCRAVAAAILGVDPRVVFKGYPDDETAATALRRGEVDLIPTLSADFTHATDATLAQSRPVLEDAVRLLVAASAKVASARELAGRKICFLAETETESAVRDYFAEHQVDFVPFPFQEQGEMEAAYTTHNCAAMAGDATRLAEVRASLTRNPAEYVLLPEHLAEDPLALTTRAGDARLTRIAGAVLNALLAAGPLGLTQHGLLPHSAAAARLLGGTHELGRPLGLADDWARVVLETTGNFQEIVGRRLSFQQISPTALPFK